MTSPLEDLSSGVLPSVPISSGTALLDSSTDVSVFETGVRRRTMLVVGSDADQGILGRIQTARELAIDLPGLDRLGALARKYLTAQPWTIDGDVFVSFRGGMRPLLHHGDLHVRGSLLIDDHAWLVVTGDLIVDGILSNHAPSTLAVGGSLRARRLVTGGNVVVLGSVDVDEIALIRGTTAPLLAGHAFVVPTLLHEGPNVCAPALVVERSIDLADSDQVALHEPRFTDDARAEGGAVDMERCDRALRCGLWPLR